MNVKKYLTDKDIWMYKIKKNGLIEDIDIQWQHR